MTHLTQLLSALLLSVSTSVFADPLKPYFQTDTFLLSEPVSIDAARNQWQGDYHTGGDKQIASVRVESGIKKGHWSVGLLYREENRLNFSSDTADLYYAVENEADLDTNRRYELDLNAYRFRGLGVSLGRDFNPRDNLRISAGASLFSASHLLEGNISGSALANSDDEYEYLFNVDYNYNEDLLFERKNIDEPTGVGLALDLGMVWKPNKRLQVSADFKDLAGAIFWKDVPYTTATANSDTVQVDENGFTQVNPVLSGKEGYLDSYKQTLKPSADLKIDYQLNNPNYIASVKTKHYEDLNLFAVGGSRAVANGKLALHYWPQIQTLEANYQGKRVGLSLGLDKLDLSEARAFWLSLSF